jgi:hypothetical protein
LPPDVLLAFLALPPLALFALPLRAVFLVAVLRLAAFFAIESPLGRNDTTICERREQKLLTVLCVVCVLRAC